MASRPDGRSGHDRRSSHVQPTDGGTAGDVAPGPGGGVSNRRFTPDPQCRNTRRKSGHLVLPPATASRCSRRSMRRSASCRGTASGSCRSGSSWSASNRPHSQAGELIAEIVLPVRHGYQGYSKVGIRNAMVIAVASACLAVDADNRRVAIALGSVGPTILRCPEAESRLAGAVDWTNDTVDGDAIEGFARLVSEASATDQRPSLDGGVPQPRGRRPRPSIGPARIHGPGSRRHEQRVLHAAGQRR